MQPEQPCAPDSRAVLFYDPAEGLYYRTVDDRIEAGSPAVATAPESAPVAEPESESVDEGEVRSTRDRILIDTMIVSDIHLGSDVSRSAELLKVLKGFRFRRLILNGDVFDDLNFTRLSKEDWKFLSHIRKLSNPKRGCEVIWVAGNHDGMAEPLSHLLGVRVYDEFAWEMNGRRYLALHGHQFDLFITQRARISNLASNIYLFLQKIDGEEQKVSRWVKRTSKAWTRVYQKIASDAISYGAARNAEFIFCGHTHIAMQSEIAGVHYFNSGCWTDRPSQFITIDDVEGVVIHDHP
jgi:UDP-2,3-diacylglucosamine pyrophosphatase LpxH